MATVLEVEDLGVRYGGQVAVQGFSSTLDEGGLLILFGPNGAGKSSVVKAIAGQVPAARGTVKLRGRDITTLTSHQRVRRGLALVPEGRGSLPGLTVEENLLLGWRGCARKRRMPRRLAIDSAWEMFPELATRRHQDCATLSGGQMQMLAIVRALLSRPDVLLLDEPSFGLAPIIVNRVSEFLTQRIAEGQTVVVVEQRAIPLGQPPSRSMILMLGRVVREYEGQFPSESELAELYLAHA